MQAVICQAHEDDESGNDTLDVEDSFPRAHAGRALFVTAHIIVKESDWQCAFRYEVDFHLVPSTDRVKIGELVCHVVECSNGRFSRVKELPQRRDAARGAEDTPSAVYRTWASELGFSEHKAALGGEKLLVVDTFRLDRP